MLQIRTVQRFLSLNRAVELFNGQKQQIDSTIDVNHCIEMLKAKFTTWNIFNINALIEELVALDARFPNQCNIIDLMSEVTSSLDKLAVQSTEKMQQELLELQLRLLKLVVGSGIASKSSHTLCAYKARCFIDRLFLFLNPSQGISKTNLIVSALRLQRMMLQYHAPEPTTFRYFLELIDEVGQISSNRLAFNYYTTAYQSQLATFLELFEACAQQGGELCMKVLEITEKVFDAILGIDLICDPDEFKCCKILARIYEAATPIHGDLSGHHCYQATQLLQLGLFTRRSIAELFCDFAEQENNSEVILSQLSNIARQCKENDHVQNICDEVFCRLEDCGQRDGATPRGSPRLQPNYLL